jgi:hypothetical protein
MRKLSFEEWSKEGNALFGPRKEFWHFVCPVCGFRQSLDMYWTLGVKDADSYIAFSCIGRFSKGKRAFEEEGAGPCTYAGGGLFRLNPVEVTDPNGNVHQMFEFAWPFIAYPADENY